MINKERELFRLMESSGLRFISGCASVGSWQNVLWPAEWAHQLLIESFWINGLSYKNSVLTRTERSVWLWESDSIGGMAGWVRALAETWTPPSIRALFGILALDARLEVVDLTLQQVQSFVQHVDLAARGQVEAVQEVGDLSDRATDRLDEFAVFPVLFDLFLDAWVGRKRLG